jgi:hypothetical protein
MPNWQMILLRKKKRTWGHGDVTPLDQVCGTPGVRSYAKGTWISYAKSPRPLVPHYISAAGLGMELIPYRVHSSSIFERSCMGTT